MTRSLDEIQQAFANALGDSRSEPALLKELSTRDTIAPRRLAFYRATLRAHWCAALASAYPVLQALVGEAYFSSMSIAYAAECSSQSGDLNSFGARLPAFLETYERDVRFGYLVDIARLEWALHTAWFAADPVVLTAQQWNEIGSETLLDGRLNVHPACTAIASQYAISDIWFAHQPGGRVPAEIQSPTWTLVVRPDWKPTLLVHGAAAHAAFVALQRQQTLNEALDAACKVDACFDIAAQIQTWIAMRVVTGVVAS